MRIALFVAFFASLVACSIDLSISPALPTQSSTIIINAQAISTVQSIDTLVLSSSEHFQTVSLGTASEISLIQSPIATISLDSAFYGGSLITLSAYLAGELVANSFDFSVANNIVNLTAIPSSAIVGSSVIFQGTCPSGSQIIDQVILYEPVSNAYQTVPVNALLSPSDNPIATVEISLNFPNGAILAVNAVLRGEKIENQLLLPLDSNQNVTLEAAFLENGNLLVQASVPNDSQLINTLILNDAVIGFTQTVGFNPVIVTNSLQTISTISLDSSFPSGAFISIKGYNNLSLVSVEPVFVINANTTVTLMNDSSPAIQGGIIVLSGLVATSGTNQEISSVILFEPVSNHWQTVSPTNPIISTVKTLIGTIILDSDFPSGSTVTVTAYNQGVALNDSLEIALSDSIINVSCPDAPSQGSVISLGFQSVFGSQILSKVRISEPVSGHVQIYNFPTCVIVPSASTTVVATVTLDNDFPSGGTLTLQGYN